PPARPERCARSCATMECDCVRAAPVRSGMRLYLLALALAACGNSGHGDHPDGGGGGGDGGNGDGSGSGSNGLGGDVCKAGGFDVLPWPTTANSPARIVSGDFDRDGITDLAVASSSAQTITVLLGKGHGAFHDMLEYPAAQESGTLAVGDIDGDGKL